MSNLYAELITLEQAAAQLGIVLEFDESSPVVTNLTEAELDDLEAKMADAEAIVIDYLKKPDHEWTLETVPGPVRAAILLVLTALYDDREGTGDGDYLKPDGAVANLLRRFRDPALA